MYIITVAGQEEKGAYTVYDDVGDRIIYIFQEEDDATRYAMMLQENENKEMVVVEIDDDLALKTCKAHNYKYAVITPDDIIIPPRYKK